MIDESKEAKKISNQNGNLQIEDENNTHSGNSSDKSPGPGEYKKGLVSKRPQLLHDLLHGLVRKASEKEVNINRLCVRYVFSFIFCTSFHFISGIICFKYCFNW